MTALEDTETQRNGQVMIVYNAGSSPVIKSYEFAKQMSGLHGVLLGRLAGVHYCYDSAVVRPFISLLLILFSKHIRSRFRPHYGELLIGPVFCAVSLASHNPKKKICYSSLL